ncbi:MAG: Gfo/Idh/MocA family oxidoreductase [Syntrophaceae bacterium]|nr:Gfo/Idh/MocA family oxidoreductase [Syntrophaceae bacterium]
MKKHRVGVIGAGAIAQACHIPGYVSSGVCELIAVADPEEKCLTMLKDNGWLFTAEYSDYREMLSRERLDVVSICTPNVFHAKIAVDCLKAGADVLLEKPIAMNMREAEFIRDAVRQHGRRLMVCFSHRFNELNLTAKQVIEDGGIGEPYMIRVRFAHTGPWPGWAKTDWFYNPELAGGGALMDMAVHAFDIVQWLVGDVTAVTCRAATLRKDIAVDDNVVAILEFGERCMGYVECGWTSPAGFCGIEIMGDNGVVFCDYGLNKTMLSKGESKPDGSMGIVESVVLDSPAEYPWVRQMEYFTAGLSRGEAFSPDIDDGIDTLRVVEAAYESNRTSARVEVQQT